MSTTTTKTETPETAWERYEATSDSDTDRLIRFLQEQEEPVSTLQLCDHLGCLNAQGRVSDARKLGFEILGSGDLPLGPDGTQLYQLAHKEPTRPPRRKVFGIVAKLDNWNGLEVTLQGVDSPLLTEADRQLIGAWVEEVVRYGLEFVAQRHFGRDKALIEKLARGEK